MTDSKIESFKALLKAKHFELAEEQYSPKSFGSWYVEWQKGHRYLRLVFDGKESWLRLEEKTLSNSRDLQDWQEKASYDIRAKEDWVNAEECLKLILENYK